METICYQREEYIPYSAAILMFMPGINEIRRLHDLLVDHDIFGNAGAFQIHPLHSTISTENQSAVFELPPVGVRKIVIGEYVPLCQPSTSHIMVALSATNIAETGITIPDITCVIDSGKHREMRYARNFEPKILSNNNNPIAKVRRKAADQPPNRDIHRQEQCDSTTWASGTSSIRLVLSHIYKVPA